MKNLVRRNALSKAVLVAAAALAVALPAATATATAATANTAGVVSPRGYPAPDPTGAYIFHGGDTIFVGWNSYHSSSGKASLHMQQDGNLVVQDENSTPRWAAGTWWASGANAVFQTDGNLVIYRDLARTQPIWSSNTSGNSGSRLFVQDDGNVVIYSYSNQPIWFTNTNH